MPTTISVVEAKRRFAQLLRKVRQGHSYVITSHGLPIARIAPVKEEGHSRAKVALLEHLKSQKIRDIGRWNRDDLYD